MNKVKGALPIIAFVFAAFAAFAFNFPENEVTSKYGSHAGDIYDVTNVNMGPDTDEYQCNGETSQCLFEDQELQNPVSSSWGEFDPGDALIPIPTK
ncbi:DUF6520 family protein [Algoriphagus sp. NG3]|uniref:DUF6520 family protein n=1 Tax=Algoriphagus sp. NG3 TaxID=3097546 RepID=UPI002A7EE4D5|nr:DUF6520 family protein [Algoriphagus sp. NG3]WPR77499.1 DUF6520 family protein [Algoriphagus sp. NG3]